MSLTRRQFVAGALSAGVTSVAAWHGFAPLKSARAAEARLIGWPSRVVQLPSEGDDHKPPVVTAVRLHKDGQWLATAGDDHLVHVWNLTSGALVHKLDGHTDWVRTIDYTPDGRILASAGNDRRILFWHAESGEKLSVFAAHDAAIAALRFSPSGRLLATVGFEGVIRIYDVESKQLVCQPAAPCQDMRAIAFSPDETLLAAGGRCGSIRIVTTDRGDLVRDLPAHRQRIRAIAFSSDGSFLASSGEDRLIHVAPLAGAGPGYSLPDRPSKVLTLTFYGPQQLAAAGSDNLIRLWDVSTRDEIGILAGHTGTIAALECRGKLLVSGGYDTTVRVWDIGDQIASGTDNPRRVGALPMIPAAPRAR